MYSNLTNFNFSEISNWVNDYALFLLRPKHVINKILIKNKEEIFRQFLFHFLIYTASFIFLSLGTTINDWIKPAIINLFFSIPLIILFLISARIVTKTNYSKEIIVYVLGFVFVSIPILIIIYATFLTSENYTFRYLIDILAGLLVLYITFNFGFAIEHDKVKALKITVVNYLLLNLIFFCFERINRDSYSQTKIIEVFNNEDPIYDEYKELITPIKYKEKLPTNRMITVFKDDIETHFLLQDVVKEKSSSSSNKEERIYLKAIHDNLKHIKVNSKIVKFKRNQIVSELWFRYFDLIKDEAEYKIESLNEIKTLKLKPYPTGKTLTYLGVDVYMMEIDILKIIDIQSQLKLYNNSIIKNHQSSTIYSDIAEAILFFFGKSADYVVGYLILKEGEPKPYTEVFLELE